MEAFTKVLALFSLKNRRCLALLLAIGLLALARSTAAHDIPADSTVRMFVKPDGQRLHVLVRVQMASINDVDWPLRRPTGYLDLARVEPFLRDASTMWISDYMDVYEGGVKLAYPTLTSVRLSPEGDTSFGTYEDALAHVTGPLIAQDMSLLPTQGALDALFDYTIQSDQSRFSIHPRFDRFGLRVLTILQFLAPNGSIRAFEYEGGDPGLVRLDPEWHQTAGTFATLGFRYLAQRHRFPAVPALPRRAVPEASPDRRDRRRVCRGALRHLRRIGVRDGARRVVVSAAGHHARCDLDSLRGGGQRHRACEPGRARRIRVFTGVG